MATNDGDWGIQVSIKHGPSDDRGNPLYMTNVRGYTATEIAEHLAHLGEHGTSIQEGINAFLAHETIVAGFPGTERVRESRYGSDHGQRKESESRFDGGELCEVHQLPRKKQSGVKNSKPWTGLFCDAPNNKCAPKWVD